jgi:hypothetical protein
MIGALSQESNASKTMSTGFATQEAVRIAIDRSCACWANGDAAGALACSREALALDPHSAAALTNLGTLMWLKGDVAEAEQRYLAARALAPEEVGVLLNLAALRNDAGDLDASIEWIDKAASLQPENAEVVWRRSLIELARGDYTNGWKHYEAGLGHPALRGEGPGFKTPAWDGSPCDRLLIWHEQGLGDTVQFIRYAELCKTRARTVQVLCPQALTALMKQCPFVDDAVESIRLRDFDQHVSVMSLPNLFGTTLTSVPTPIPYLCADDESVAGWRKRMHGGRPKVGLVWAGHARKALRFNIIDEQRSIALGQMQPWLDLAGIEFYSLQKGEAAQQARGRNIVDLMDDVGHFADTAAVIANLDLVISVDTAVAHVAGAMGKPVWVLSRFDACWRWLRNRTDSPWYPSARVFGQTQRGDWTDVVMRIRDELSALGCRTWLTDD